MAAYTNIGLVLTAPQNPALVLAGGSATIGDHDTTAAFTTSDGDTTGYQIKVWGDIAGGPATEGAAAWEAFTASRAIALAAGDGLKTISGRIRDDVGNETAVLTDTVTVDTTVPVVTVGAPSQPKVSKVAGFRTSTVSFTSDTVFEQYEVQVVPATGSTRDEGVVIPTTNGSINTSGNAGGYAADTPIQVTIDGADLEIASPGDGTKIVKIFVRDAAGNWSS
jgi:hypothetical protein